MRSQDLSEGLMSGKTHTRALQLRGIPAMLAGRRQVGGFVLKPFAYVNRSIKCMSLGVPNWLSKASFEALTVSQASKAVCNALSRGHAYRTVFTHI